MTKPSIVLVPGSFASKGAYSDIVDKLRAKGYPALAIDLPSTEKRQGLEPATMQEDAKAIRSVVEALISQGKEVVVSAHSYGGTPMTEALAGVAVKRMIYVAAVAPRVGQSQADALATPLVQMVIDSAVGGYMLNDPVLIAGAIGNDFDSWEYAYECAQKLPHHSAVSFTGTVTQAGYETNPVSWIFTEKDVIVTPELQERFIKTVEEVSGKDICVVRKPWGHCPNWGRPDEFVDALIAEAEK